MLRALPAAIYRTDAAGRIIYYNEAAVDLWGFQPELGRTEFCGSWKLFWPDGSFLARHECASAIALKEKRAVRGMEAVVERPDGSRVPFLAYAAPMFDVSGDLTGTVNVLVDLLAPRQAEHAAQHYAAIVESSEAAILSKDLWGIITSWNQGAQRLFGYTAEEAIGRPGTMLLPPDRQDEEPVILERIRRGEHIDHYETIRQRKDGSLVDVSLTVSPIKDPHGRILGASKIARDITESKRAQEQRDLLLREMDHRVKNLFAVSNSIVSLIARSANTPRDLALSVSERLAALARAHALTLSSGAIDGGGRPDRPTTLHALIRTILFPYDGSAEGGMSRATISGPDIPLSTSAVTGLALLLHEFATNAAKYGALSFPTGVIEIQCSEERDNFVLAWTERGGPSVVNPGDVEGFGGLLTRTTVRGQFGGEISRDWKPDGLSIRLAAPRARLSQ